MTETPLRFLKLAWCGFILFTGAALAAAEEQPQTTLLDQFNKTYEELGLASQNNNPLSTYAGQFRLTGAPVLNRLLGLNLTAITTSTATQGILMVLLALLLGGRVLGALTRQQPLGEFVPELVVKAIAGIVVFHMPWLVYAIAMTLGSIGIGVANSIWDKLPADFKATQARVSETQLLFDMAQTDGILRSIQDNSQVLNGVGTEVAYPIYNAFVMRAMAVDKTRLLQSIQPGDESGDAAIQTIQKQRFMQGNLAKVFQVLSADETGSPRLMFFRVGPDGHPDFRSGVASQTIYLSPHTYAGFDGTPVGQNAVYVNIPTYHALLADARATKAGFISAVNNQAFETRPEFETGRQVAVEKYRSQVETATAVLIRMTFWKNLGFAGFTIATDRDFNNQLILPAYVKGKPPQEQEKIRQHATRLQAWYIATTARPGASVSNAEQGAGIFTRLAKWLVSMLSWIKDILLTSLVLKLWMAAIELYTYVIWFTYVLWFYEPTEKAFKGAISILITAALVPGLIIFLQTIWDMIIAHGMAASMGIVGTVAAASLVFPPMAFAIPAIAAWAVFWIVCYLVGAFLICLLAPRLVQAVLSGTSVLGTLAGAMATAVVGGALAAVTAGTGVAAIGTAGGAAAAGGTSPAAGSQTAGSPGTGAATSGGASPTAVGNPVDPAIASTSDTYAAQATQSKPAPETSRVKKAVSEMAATSPENTPAEEEPPAQPDPLPAPTVAASDPVATKPVNSDLAMPLSARLDAIPGRRAAREALTRVGRVVRSGARTDIGKLALAGTREGARHLLAAAESDGNVSDYLSSYYSNNKTPWLNPKESGEKPTESQDSHEV